MSGSIVERLRDWPAGGQDMLSASVVGDMMTEAADTIEAMQALVDENLGTLEEQRRRCIRWGKPHHEIDAAINQTRAALAKVSTLPTEEPS